MANPQITSFLAKAREVVEDPCKHVSKIKTEQFTLEGDIAKSYKIGLLFYEMVLGKNASAFHADIFLNGINGINNHIQSIVNVNSLPERKEEQDGS